VSNPTENNPTDILWGATAIAFAINRDERAVYHLLEGGHITAAKKIGGRWCASRRRLLEMFEAVAA
jgi:hypothetical protein